MKFFRDPSPIIYISLITAISSFSGLLLGFDAGIIGVSKDQVTRLFGLSDNQWSIIASASILGAFVGLPICGKINHLLGPKKILICVSVGFIGGILLTAFSHEMYSFLVGRFLIGVCVGMGSFMAPLFISEISLPNIRGSLLLMNSIALTTGQTLLLFTARRAFIHGSFFPFCLFTSLVTVLVWDLYFGSLSPKFILCKLA